MRITLPMLVLVLITLFAGLTQANAEPIHEASITEEVPVMAFCTYDDMVTEYGTKRLARVTGDAQGLEVNQDEVQRQIDSFAGYMEPFIRMQHPDQPFDETHDFLRGLNVEGAWVRLKKASPGETEQVVLDSEKRLDRILAALGKGEPRLMNAAEVADPDTVLDQSKMIRANENLFGGHRTAQSFS